MLTLAGGTQLGLDEITPNLGGGMSFATADYARAARAIYQGAEPPLVTDALYSYLVLRQTDNLDLLTIQRIVSVMSPTTPDSSVSSYGNGGAISRSSSVLSELANARRDIDLGQLSSVALIETVMQDPRTLGSLHRQVLAYAYDALDDGSTLVHIYDTEYPLDDSVTLYVPYAADATAPITLTYSHGVIAGLFRTPYAAKTPPA